MTQPVEARDILLGTTRRLAEAGIDGAALDCRLLLAAALDRDEAVLPHETLTGFDDAAAARFAAFVERRLAGEPVSRIRGWREFWSLRLDLSEATLDPRADSETLVVAALDEAGAARDRALRILDLGCGTGALVLACLSELRAASGCGIDIDPLAVETARGNAERLGLADRASFHQGDFADSSAGGGGFDLVLCNPPYIPSRDIGSLAPEVARFDPRRALDGGDDGLSCWRAVLPRIAGGLRDDGRALVEIGAGQEEDVARLARVSGLAERRRVRDLGGIVRCLVFSHDEGHLPDERLSG